ncbi:hypothetical protein ACQV2E_23335 [Pantoea allii]|uniref:Uncharacterized protein n=1 Tax=Pantoea allii TaxID=574096 RepID=A0ABS6VL77_9GAMM|nr:MULTISPECIES: hypothetical protein [Pantoea]MBW1216476.1 hypothetical protein [Pantoea allii]MBW1254664.1 hypothetical protein [Pantoea allii]MBW1260092.1 hypothetical protein [Pantoea allii]MBW1263676.1 hypothetical protein [Pantoea allii]MBW1269183.1 hypothetical protein [Pantoea allii]
MQEMNQARFAEGDARMNFLPMLFSSDFLRSEVNVYHYAERFLEGYKGKRLTCTVLRFIGSAHFTLTAQVMLVSSNRL